MFNTEQIEPLIVSGSDVLRGGYGTVATKDYRSWHRIICYMPSGPKKLHMAFIAITLSVVNKFS